MGSACLTKRLVIHINSSGVMLNDMDMANSVEMAFSLPGESRLQISAGNSDNKVLDFLTHAVARKPGDLRSHIQRINIYIKRADYEGLYGALLDLFIALMNKGHPLRERMLKVSKPVLDQARYQFLYEHLDKGISAMDAVPLSSISVLAKGIVGTNKLVHKLHIGKNAERDALEEAHEHLEYGQVEEAQQVLEEAILKNPSREELYHELIDIYRYTNARKSFVKMQKQLIELGAFTPDAWDELAKLFGENE